MRVYVDQTVRTCAPLRDYEFLVPKHHKTARRAGARGYVYKILGKGVVLVQNEGDLVPAVYHVDELEPQAAVWRVRYRNPGVGPLEKVVHTRKHGFRILEELRTNLGVSGVLDGPFYLDKKPKSKRKAQPIIVKSLFDQLTDDEA
jgi:hypothetical protein